MYFYFFIGENKLTYWHVVVSQFNVSGGTLCRCSYEKVLWKYAANLHEKTHSKVWFQ